jgi:drug/metabolite transporter (DMT)-like permease
MKTRHDHLDSLAIGLLLACCLFWGFQQVLVKATLPEVPPLLQAAVRFAGATLLLWVWCHHRGVALFERDGSLWVGLQAGALFCGEFVCIYLGLNHITASRLTVFLYTAPFWVAGVLPLLVHSERLRVQQWLGLGVAFVAVVYAVSGGASAQNSHNDAWWWVGDALALGAGALWGLTTVLIRSTRLSSLSAEKLLYYQVAFSAFALPIVSLQLGEVWSFDVSTFAWVSIALQTVIGAFMSYLVWMWLLGRYPATKLSVFVFLTPIFALIIGAVWLGEPVTLDLVIALVGVSAGIVLVNRKPPAAQG